MRAGKLRHRIEIWNPTRTSDNQGGFSKTTNKLTRRTWAEYSPLSSREEIEAHQVSPKISGRFLMRYNDDVTGDSKIKFRNRWFSVFPPVNVEEKNAELTVLVEEITD